MRETQTVDKGKILQFEQPGDFYYRAGVSRVENNDLPKAMTFYRQALKREPDNHEYMLAMAELLTEIGRYEESNALLLLGFPSDAVPPEAYFGMGCNFLSLRDFGYAYDCFMKYVEAEPDGDYADEAYDMLNAIKSAPDADGQYPASTMEAVRLTLIGRDQLASGNSRNAVEVLTEALEADPNWLPAHNCLALAYYGEHEPAKAAEHVSFVLKADPLNRQANCNLVLFAHRVGDESAVARGLANLERTAPDDPEDITAVSLVYIELGMYEKARAALTKALSVYPYDVNINHRLALCEYELGDYRSAALRYDRLSRLDENDTVAKYYLDICRSAADAGERRGDIQPEYQVPYGEMMSRIKRFRKYVNMSIEDLKKAWDTDDSLESLVRWLEKLPPSELKITVAELMSHVGGEKAERLLREMALSRVQSVEVKNKVFEALFRIGAKEPYVGYINGKIVEGRISPVALSGRKLHHSYANVLQTCVTMMRENGASDDCVQKALDIWKLYVELVPEPKPISGPRVFSFAAALEYIAREGTPCMLSMDELCTLYRISRIRFNNAYKAITALMEATR